MPDSTQTTGTALLINWANQRDHWVRALVAEVLQTRKPLSAQQVEHFYDLLLREKELSEGDPVVTRPIPTDTTAADGEEDLALEALDSVENVNALASGQEIEFCRYRSRIFIAQGASLRHSPFTRVEWEATMGKIAFEIPILYE